MTCSRKVFYKSFSQVQVVPKYLYLFALDCVHILSPHSALQKTVMELTCFQVFVTMLFLLQFEATPSLAMRLAPPNITTDQSSLLAFKTYITNFNSFPTLVSSWTTTTPSSVCDWVGITCGKLHRRVEGIYLPNMGLIGTIPPHLGNLSFLMRFNINNNSFSGVLPKELGNLRRLQYINVGFNNFHGQIPQWFGAFPKLGILSVQNNSFSGSLPQEIGNLQSLTTLNMQANQFTGSIPRTIFNMSSLQVLALSDNSLSGNLPTDICNHLPNLEQLFLPNNELGGQIPPGLQECSKLQVLSLAINQFTGRIPREIGNLTMLNSLVFDSNNLEGLIPHFLFNMSSLQVISVKENNLSGSLPRNICPQGSALLELYVGRNPLTGGIPYDIGNCTSIQEIDLQQNNLTEYGREGLVSTRCDVYSFGIMLMEIFTRKKPTDEMFNSGLSLKTWVSEALANNVIQAIDSNLVRQEEGQFTVKVKCVSSIYELALNCSAESPEERINMKDALVLLKKIRLEFLANLSRFGM
ncbi:hypothetical protein Vadar_013383 [Vaccinium darrowii]|uniref:Uncharacterized protein n=1 Tax=Vaccinium darrowii TaxID=229202 RepID=A0ACB7ZBG4_9ERIC|nr:hypothetical protein Vadar_013383 [Vaccinium darrowii]